MIFIIPLLFKYRLALLIFLILCCYLFNTSWAGLSHPIFHMLLLCLVQGCSFCIELFCLLFFFYVSQYGKLRVKKFASFELVKSHLLLAFLRVGLLGIFGVVFFSSNIVLDSSVRQIFSITIQCTFINLITEESLL